MMCDYRLPNLTMQTLHNRHKLRYMHKLGCDYHGDDVFKSPIRYAGNGFAHVAHLNAVSMETAYL